jgi:hypothetical protein
MCPKATIICDEGDWQDSDCDLPSGSQKHYYHVPESGLNQLHLPTVLKLQIHHLESATQFGLAHGHKSFHAFFINGPAGDIEVGSGCVIFEPNKKERI